MAYTRQYTEGVGWQNAPSLASPINATNLNKMDGGIMDVDEAVAEEFESVEQAISELEDAVEGAVTDVSATHNYSTTEHVVGTWIDGSTLYERTWDLGSDVSFPNNAWTIINAITGISFDKIIRAEGVQDSASAVSIDVWYDDANNTLKVKSLRTDNELMRYLTLQYTKA